MHQALPRRRFLTSLARLGALSVAGLGGCASSIPADSHGPAKNSLAQQSYTETINSLLVSKDNKNIVFIGRNYHYVLAAPPMLVQCLASTLHPKIKGEISGLHVDPQGQISGAYRLFLTAPASPSEAETAHALGFTSAAASPEEGGDWQASGELTGQRFVRGTLREGRQLEPLNQSYTVEITAEQSRADVVADKLATPLTMGSDGVLLLYYIVLAPVLIPLTLISREPRR